MEEDICKGLNKRGIPISVREVSYLAKKFIVNLAIAHKESVGEISELLSSRGGYILHLDGTCEGGSPHLMCGMDGISKIVLDNIKLPSEKSEKIIPFLKRIKNAFGIPLALVHDMGSGILQSIETVFKGIADFICHYHFLRDIGKDLFEEENDIVRKRLRHHGIQALLLKKANQLKKKIDCDTGMINSVTKSLENNRIEPADIEQTPLVVAYVLIQWALDGKKQGNGYGFPFDQPYLSFYQRLQTLHEVCEELQPMQLQGSFWRDNKHFYKIYFLLEKTLRDKKMHAAAMDMQEKIIVFEELREAMRIADPTDKQGLNDSSEDVDIKTIEKEVKIFRHWLTNHETYLKHKNYQKMIKQIDKYWKKLFSDPIIVETRNGKIAIQPQRTNNILERFFRGLKRDSRKKSGSISVGKTLKAMLADAPLVKNLENPQYLKIILNGKASLEERFAEIDTKIVREELKKSQEDLQKVPKKIRTIIKIPELPKAFINLFAGQLKI